jgi:hypothetical protein
MQIAPTADKMQVRTTDGVVWTFIALDADTKLIPSYVVGKRDSYHAGFHVRFGTHGTPSKFQPIQSRLILTRLSADSERKLTTGKS